jgi:outer membrane lipoprotein-sorting protein
MSSIAGKKDLAMRLIVSVLLALMCSVALGDFQPIAPDATADQVLDALKARGDTMTDFTADVKLTKVNDATADSSADSGKVLFQKLGDGDGRIRVGFTQRVEGDKTFGENHEYTLADRWLVERDYSKKSEIRREVIRPGEKVNLLRLGQGPFPLPIGQDRQDVKKQFDVSLVAAAKDDPAGTVHLLLKPKDQTDLARRFAQIDVWVELKSGMPIRIVTLDANHENTQTTELTDIRLNTNLTDADFALPKVDGWDVTEEPYQQ